jgi:hypothetical protein
VNWLPIDHPKTKHQSAKEYNIKQDAEWIIGSLLIDLPLPEIQKYAGRVLGIQVKPRWSKHKLLSRVLRQTFNLIREAEEDFIDIVLPDLIESDLLERDPSSLLRDYSADIIALALNHSGTAETYHNFVQKHNRKIHKKLHKRKTAVMPYLEDSSLSEEIFRLRDREEKLLSENQKKQNRLELLQQKIDRMSGTINDLKNRLERESQNSKNVEPETKIIEKIKVVEPPPSNTNQQNKGVVVRCPDGNGYIASFQGKPLYTPFAFLQDNSLLHGDVVKIKSSEPLKVSLAEPTENRVTTTGAIQVQDMQYIVLNKHRRICIGFVNRFLPEGARARIVYVPDSDYGIIEHIYPFSKKDNSTRKKPRQNDLTVYVAGGVKESIYRDIVGEKNLLWSSGDETNRSIIRANVQKADVVFIIFNYISHVTYDLTCEYCKSLEIPFYFINSTGHTEFKELYRKILQEGKPC